MENAVCYFWKYGGYKACDESIVNYCKKRGIRIVNIPIESTGYPAILKDWCKVFDIIQDDIQKNKPKLCFSSNHALNVCIMAGFMQKYSDIVYIDAHADCNTPETSESKNIHGMGLAALCKKGYKPLTNKFKFSAGQIYGVAMRSIDKDELSNVKQLKQVDLTSINPKQKYCISVDVDALDPKYYTSCHYNVPNGLSPKDIREFFEKIVLKNIGVIEISEINNLTEKDAQTLDYILEPVFNKLI